MRPRFVRLYQVVWAAVGVVDVTVSFALSACLLARQGSCSVGVSLDHRSTKTGAPDDERSLTIRRLAELYQEVRVGHTSAVCHASAPCAPVCGRR